jgi:hypothetical protein
MSDKISYNFTIDSEKFNCFLKNLISEAIKLYGPSKFDFIFDLDKLNNLTYDFILECLPPECSSSSPEGSSSSPGGSSSAPGGSSSQNSSTQANLQLISNIVDGAIILSGSIIAIGEAAQPTSVNNFKIKVSGSNIISGVGTTISIFLDYKSGESLTQAITSRTVGFLAGGIAAVAVGSLFATTAAPIIVVGITATIVSYLASEIANALVDKMFSFFQSEMPSLPSIPLTQASPLVFDLNGNGIKTLHLNDGVYFDHNSNQFAEKIGWINPNDAFLARDINFNDLIYNCSELFRDNTLLLNGQ